MKATVIQFFKNLPTRKEDQFNEALQLFRKCPGKGIGQERFYNRAGYNPANLENLFYDLKKVVSITDADIKNATKVDVVVDQKEIVDSFKDTPVIPVDKKLILDVISEESGVETKEEVFTKAPDEVKEAVKFRDEFPFLNEKDCPEEFHILVGKKFASYYAWIEAHKHLLVNIKDINEDASPIAMSDEEIDEVALKAVVDFEVNQLIWKELNHYKTSGEILGKHPIFLERALKDDIEKMTNAQASKRLVNLDNYIRRDKRNLEKAQKAKKEADITKYADKITKWQTEEKLIKAKHNL